MEKGAARRMGMACFLMAPIRRCNTCLPCRTRKGMWPRNVGGGMRRWAMAEACVRGVKQGGGAGDGCWSVRR